MVIIGAISLAYDNSSWFGLEIARDPCHLAFYGGINKASIVQRITGPEGATLGIENWMLRWKHMVFVVHYSVYQCQMDMKKIMKSPLGLCYQTSLYKPNQPGWILCYMLRLAMCFSNIQLLCNVP